MRGVQTLSLLAVLSLAACSDGGLFPTERHLAAGSARAAVVAQRRPFRISQSWTPGDNDFVSYPNCLVAIPNPTNPGTSMDIVISGLLHTSGTATHFGRYAADSYIDDCTWNAQLGKLDVHGHLDAVVASGDKVWGTYQAYVTFGVNGSDFAGTMSIDSGTGRFRGASGTSSLNSHDAPDGSGVGWGSGWIAY